ncbi:MAG: hypothetical protein Q8Q56_03410 [Alphaproteobacteria bacterium]|nr:hypothetical protein [Alphaproteobacteria bacterium]
MICLALTLCGVFTTNAAADEATIFGVPAIVMTTEGAIVALKANPNEITMLNILKTGVKGQTGGFSNNPDTIDCVKTMFAENPPSLVAGSFMSKSSAARLGGSIVGKSQTTISAESFSFQPLTVFGTNGQFTPNFTNPHSLIKSITLDSSNITVNYNGEELHIGSVWGDFTGAPSSDAQIIHFVGYHRITIQFNPETIAELLSKK